MNKKYIVRLSDEERGVCQEVVKRLKGSSERVKRAQILLKADVTGPSWSDTKIAAAFDCRVQTVETLRKRLVIVGFEAALERKRRATPPTPRKLDGADVARRPTDFRSGSQKIRRADPDDEEQAEKTQLRPRAEDLPSRHFHKSASSCR